MEKEIVSKREHRIALIVLTIIEATERKSNNLSNLYLSGQNRLLKNGHSGEFEGRGFDSHPLANLKYEIFKSNDYYFKD